MTRAGAIRSVVVWALAVVASAFAIAVFSSFPTQLQSLVSNLDAARADRLIAAHFGLGENETTLYCATGPEGERALSPGLSSLADACEAGNAVPATPGSLRLVSRGALSATPRILLLEGFDLASTARADGHPPQTLRQPLDAVPESDQLRQSEFWSLILTALALLLVFRSLRSSLIALAVAGATVIVVWGICALLSTIITLPFVIVSITSLIALALGADLASQACYGAFRHDLIPRRIVAIASFAVAATLVPLLLIPISGFRVMVLGAVIASAVAALAARTLLPAITSLTQSRDVALEAETPLRWSPIRTLVGWSLRKPVLAFGAVCLLLAIPAIVGVKELRSPHPISRQERVMQNGQSASQQLFSAEFEGMVRSIVEIVLPVHGDVTQPYDAISTMVDGLSGQSGFANPIFVQWSSDQRVAVVTIFSTASNPSSAYQDARTLIESNQGPAGTALIGGLTMLGAEFDRALRGRSMIVFLAGIGLASLVLAAGYRQVLMVSVMMSGAALSALASLGLLSWIIKSGVAIGPFSIAAQEWLDPWAPIVICTVVIATSASYASIVLAQISAASRADDAPSIAFANAIGQAPQLSTAAAASLIGIGIGFTAADVPSLQQAGAGLALALLIQAVIVRGVVTPALLALVQQRRVNG